MKAVKLGADWSHLIEYLNMTYVGERMKLLYCISQDKEALAKMLASAPRVVSIYYEQMGQTTFWGAGRQVDVRNMMSDNCTITTVYISLYAGTSCQVKSGDRQSEVLNVNVGLRQGCVLSLVLFSLYIHSLVDQLKSASCRIECAGESIPGLLFADDTTLLAPDASGIKKSLAMLVQWCKEWG